MTKRKPGAVRGGKRPNSGRKPYPPDVRAYLATTDAAEATTAAIRSSRGYKIWEKRNKESES